MLASPSSFKGLLKKAQKVYDEAYAMTRGNRCRWFYQNCHMERDLSRVFFTKTFAVIYEFIFFNFLIKDRQTSVNLNFHVIKENLKRSKLKLV